MSTEMIERVAAALARAADEPFDEIYKAKYMGDARAAIEAMREPTQAMLAIGEGYMDFVLPDAVGENTPQGRQQEFKLGWVKAIDVALGLYPKEMAAKAK